MQWIPEKLCSSQGAYELLIERLKNGYECEARTQSWKWRVIHSGVILSQGVSNDMAAAQKMAEANIPAT